MSAAALPQGAATEFALARPLRTDRRSPRRWVLSHVKRHGWLLPLVLVGAFGNAALAGVVPLYGGEAVDAVKAQLAGTMAAGAARAVVVRAAWLIILSQAIRGVLQLGRNFGSEALGQRLERDIRDELYAALLGKSMTFHGRQKAGDVMARATNDVREVNLMFNPGLNLAIGSSMFLIIPIAFAPRIHPQLVWVPVLFLLGYAWAVRRYLRQLAPVTTAVRERFGRLNSHLTEVVDGIEVVKGAAQEEAEVGRFMTNAEAYRQSFVALGEREARYLPALLMGVATSAGFAQALYLLRAGAISTGDLVAFMGLLSLFGFPTFTSLFSFSQVSSGMAGARRILELINLETDLDQNRGGHAAVIRGELCFQAATFGYDPAQPVLQGIDVRIAAGQTVAIVGQTGSGKSSLTRLVNRIFDVQEGAVLVDGVDVRDWDLEALRRQIAVIEQDPFLFSRSVAENIAFGRPEAARAEVEAAARAAQAHDFILALPEGYDTVIGERGVTLSGGQRQRLAIARALLTEPRILILDDSTSAIDSATEDRIQRAMVQAAQGRTTLLITHRLSQIRWADLVLVLRGGRLEAAGSHEDLMARSAPYRRLFARAG